MNLERSATNSLPRPGKPHDGLGTTGQLGRDGIAPGGDGGFLSVLAALDSLALAGPLDITAAPPGSCGGLDTGASLPGVEPELPDATQLSPDAGWQVDTAAWLAHLNRSSQWASSAGAQAPESTQPTELVAASVLASAAGVSSRMESDLAPTSTLSPPVAPSEPANLRSAPPPTSCELDVTTLQAVLAQSAVSGSMVGQASPAPADLAKPGASRPPPDALDPALVALPLDLLRPASTRSSIDLPQPVVSWSGASSTMAAMRGLTRAPQTEVVQATGEAAGMGSAVAPMSALDEIKPALMQHAELAKPMVSAAGSAQAAHDTKIRQSFVETHLAAAATVGSSAALPMGLVEGFSRSADRVVAKPTESHHGATGEGFWGPHGLVSGRSVEAASATQNGALPTPEMMVAEQVSYWITGRVQNAELRLDVFGRQPVDVSISMHGSEAQVEFRTDQPEIRQVLEGAVAHLKDLLKEEGLSLGGVFVGSSGQQRQGGHGPSSHPRGAGLRQAPVEGAHATVSVKQAAGRPIAGRSVDLFV